MYLFPTQTKQQEHEGGLICEVKSLDQLSEEFEKDIEKYNSPRMICGYTSCANALYIAENYPQTRMTKKEVNKMICELRNPSIMVPRIIPLLKLWNEWRREWVNSHREDFTRTTENNYLKDWVANYEISDWMKKVAKHPKIAFTRLVEYDLETIKHEELVRLDEEIPFRLKDFIFMDDPFLNPEKTTLWHPKDWVEAHKNSNNPSSVFVTCLPGHFLVTKPILLVDGDETKQISLVINSYFSDYVPNKALSAFHSLYFHHDVDACIERRKAPIKTFPV